MMPWKPSEGLKRADSLVTQIEQDAAACGSPMAGWSEYRLLRHRMVEVIAKALDQALSDGSEQDALATLGNGHAAGRPFPTPGPSPSEAIAWGMAPATADHVGFDPGGIDQTVEQHEEGPGAPPPRISLAVPPEEDAKSKRKPKPKKAKRRAKAAKAPADAPVDSAPAKKRGRPSKADIAARDTTVAPAPVEAPVEGEAAP